MALFLVLSPANMAEPVFAELSTSVKTGSARLVSAGLVSSGNSSASISSAGISSAGLSSAGTAGKLTGAAIRLHEELKALEKRSQEYVHAALIRELLAGYDLLRSIPEDAPWLVRVNQTTCTVTVYRLLQVPKEDVPFGRGYDTIVQDAAKEAREAVRKEKEEQRAEAEAARQNGERRNPKGEAGSRKASEQDTSSGQQADGTRTNGAQGDGTEETEEEPLREFRHIVLRQLKRTSAPDNKSIQNVTLKVPVYACPCSVGVDGRTPTGTYKVYSHLRWHELVGPTWGQWCCHFAPSYLFHSLPYDRPNDPNSLQKDVYNQIGTAASHGCVRLVAEDAKYIYDHIPNGGQVEIFYGTEADDPLGRPERPYIGEWEESYDPTDPEFRPEQK